MNIDFKAFLDERVLGSARQWALDLAAHRDDQLTNRFSETSRSIADIAYETILVNRRIAARIRSDVPEPMDGFPTCPPELATTAKLAEAITESAQAIVDAVGEDYLREVEFPSGAKEPAWTYAEFAAIHMQYHLGQINFVQTLYGDTTVHWKM